MAAVISLSELQIGDELGRGQFGCVNRAKYKGQVRLTMIQPLCC